MLPLYQIWMLRENDKNIDNRLAHIDTYNKFSKDPVLVKFLPVLKENYFTFVLSLRYLYLGFKYLLIYNKKSLRYLSEFYPFMGFSKHCYSKILYLLSFYPSFRDCFALYLFLFS
mgnify:CR=1 FL=1